MVDSPYRLADCEWRGGYGAKPLRLPRAPAPQLDKIQKNLDFLSAATMAAKPPTHAHAEARVGTGKHTAQQMKPDVHVREGGVENFEIRVINMLEN